MSYNDQATKPTVAILYGTGEGKRIGKRLCRLLKERGFVCTNNVQEADAIIAHSGGVLLIPPSNTARAILIVGPITGFRGNFFRAVFKKVHQDFQGAKQQGRLRPFLGKSLHNMSYILSKPRHHFRMLKAMAEGRRTLPQLKAPRVAVIAFRDDPWSGFLAANAPHDRHSYSFIHYNTLHDHLWEEPENYVAILEYLYAD